jgi:hypothetical protein
MPPEVFVSYASVDRDRVLRIADRLAAAGVSLWIDRTGIPGGTSYGEAIVRGIKSSKVLLLMVSHASMRSRNVRAEIQLAWKYERPYLPLLLEAIEFPEQIEYWLEGWQWIDASNALEHQWLPRLLDALTLKGVGVRGRVPAGAAASPTQTAEPGLSSLMSMARFTDQIWPLPAERPMRSEGALRGLGAPQDDVEREFTLGSRVRLIIECEREGHLLLLNQGADGLTYCLCPSWFAPSTRVHVGRNEYPQPESRYRGFVVTGKSGREQLLAVITDESLDVDWMPAEPKTPSRVLTADDIGAVLERLRELPSDRWMVMATYFDVGP